MPLAKRITIFSALWLLAGVLCAVFSEISVEAGESELLVRLQIVYLVPLIAASAIAFTVVRGHYETIVGLLLLAIFVVHAVIALTRQTRRQFMVLLAIQVLILIASVYFVLYFFHYDATHGHG
jgi:hypothetical protein